MKVNSKHPRATKASPQRKDRTASRVRIDLTAVERELLLKACMQYRHTIPAYIQSRQPELDALNAVIDKLA
jgi:hypothetical protein